MRLVDFGKLQSIDQRLPFWRTCVKSTWNFIVRLEFYAWKLCIFHLENLEFSFEKSWLPWLFIVIWLSWVSKNVPQLMLNKLNTPVSQKCDLHRQYAMSAHTIVFSVNKTVWLYRHNIIIMSIFWAMLEFYHYHSIIDLERG